MYCNFCVYCSALYVCIKILLYQAQAFFLIVHCMEIQKVSLIFVTYVRNPEDQNVQKIIFGIKVPFYAPVHSLKQKCLCQIFSHFKFQPPPTLNRRNFHFICNLPVNVWGATIKG